MKSIKIFFGLFFILNSTIIFSQDTLYLPHDLIFTNYFNSIYDNDDIKSLDIENYIFDGYLVIKIDSLSKIVSNVSFHTTVFWVNSLKDVYNINKFYWYTPYVGTILKLAKSYMSYMDLSNDTTRCNIYNFIKYYLIFNENNHECRSFLYKDSTALRTDMLQNNLKLWNGYKKEKATYIVYRASFVAAVLTLKIPIIFSEKQRIENVRIFVPITPLNKFEPITEDVASENGFNEDKSLKILLK